MLKGALAAVMCAAMTTSGCIYWPQHHPRPVRVYRAAPSAGPLIVVPRRRGRVVLIDPRRKRCFLQVGRILRLIDCRRVPEARSEFGLDRRTQPREEPRRLTTPRVYPTTPPRSVPGKVVNPRRAKPPSYSLGAPPTPAERQRFKEAYKAVYCARRTGSTASSRAIIKKLGLEFERYSQIEGWMAKEGKVWATLGRSARAMCPTKR